MKIIDSVYGEIKITEPVLIELINSKPLLRMKGVYQAGLLRNVLLWKQTTRFEHCIGAMILLKIKGAKLEEQIAGLLHDIPHTAFSHAIDYVYKNEEHNFHEMFHEKIINESEIPSILRKYKFDAKRLINEENFSLLERPSPDLCADRIDYTLRELMAKNKDTEKINKYINSIVVFENEFYFNNAQTALEFSKDFLEMIQSWASPLQLAVVETLALALRKSLNENIITQEDLFTTDQKVLDKIYASKNKEIIDILEMINPNMKVIEDDKNFDYYSKEKLRYIDPKILPNNKRVSEIYPEYKELIEKHKEILSRGVHARILQK